MIRTHNLTKRYGSVLAVDDLSIDVRPGDIYGFLGANGSGKTTTVRMLLGLVLATSGRIDLLDEPMPKAAKQVLPQVGALIEGPAAYGHLSGRENLRLLDAAGPGSERASRRTRIDEALEQVGLDAVGKRPVKAYSLGMRQRLGLAAALLRTPRLLVLDEPTNGLDPQGIREIGDLLLRLNSAGTTVFLSSHLLAEVEHLCTRVGVLDRGRLVLQEDLQTLTAPTGNTIVVTGDVEAAARLFGDAIVSRSAQRITIGVPDSAAVNERLVMGGVRVSEIVPERPTLEQVVLQATHAGSDRQSTDPQTIDITAEEVSR